MISSVSDTNIFEELGASSSEPEPEQQQLTLETKPKDLRLRAQHVPLRYKDDRIDDPNIRQWMEDRRLGVGASEIAVLFGLSPWQNLYQLWREKVHGCSYEPGSELFHWGHTMEPVIAAEFSRRMGVEVDDPAEAITIGEKPYYRASLDRVILENGEPVAALELKNLNESRYSEYKAAGPSVGYLLQLQYQMMVSGFDYGYLAVLFGGQRFETWRVLASPSIQREIRARIDQFWEYVQNETPPPEQLGTKTVSSNDEHVLVLSDPAWEAKMDQLDKLRVQKAKIEKEEKVLKQQVKECMGDFQSAQAGQMIASVTCSVRNSLDAARLKEEQPELVRKYMKENEVRFVRIRRRS